MADLSATLDRPFWPALAEAAQPPAYRVEVLHDWAAAAGLWRAQTDAAGTPFQNAVWLDAFYAAAKHNRQVEPLIVLLRDAASGVFALGLPLILRRDGGTRVIECADLGMTDFNSPLMGPAAPRTQEAAAAAWAAIRRALPPADFLRLAKMPDAVSGRRNPFARLSGASLSAVNGNLVTTGEDFDAWRHSLERTSRKELERSWRVFTRHPDAAFRAVTDPDEALRILAVMETQQRERMAELGQPYKLDNPVTAALYREVLGRGVAGGFAVLTLLTAGDEIVAALLGVRQGDSYVMIRLTHGGAAWSKSSPGRLIISRTMAHLHEQGVRKFDFSVGNFTYKRRFGVVRQPLTDFAVALSLRGLRPLARMRAGEWLRRHPGLRRIAHRVLGKAPSREED